MEVRAYNIHKKIPTTLLCFKSYDIFLYPLTFYLHYQSHSCVLRRLPIPTVLHISPAIYNSAGSSTFNIYPKCLQDPEVPHWTDMGATTTTSAERTSMRLPRDVTSRAHRAWLHRRLAQVCHCYHNLNRQQELKSRALVNTPTDPVSVIQYPQVLRHLRAAEAILT